jgi:hypothetical protein
MVITPTGRETQRRYDAKALRQKSEILFVPLGLGVFALNSIAI